MTRDYELYPDDDNGNVLWQMAEDGDDLSEPHEIEYSIAFQEQSQAEKCALYLLQEEQKSLCLSMKKATYLSGLLPFTCIWNLSIQT